MKGIRENFAKQGLTFPFEEHYSNHSRRKISINGNKPAGLRPTYPRPPGGRESLRLSSSCPPPARLLRRSALATSLAPRPGQGHREGRTAPSGTGAEGAKSSGPNVPRVGTELIAGSVLLPDGSEKRRVARRTDGAGCGLQGSAAHPPGSSGENHRGHQAHQPVPDRARRGPRSVLSRGSARLSQAPEDGQRGDADAKTANGTPHPASPRPAPGRPTAPGPHTRAKQRGPYRR